MAANSQDKFKLASNGTRPSPTTLTALKSIGASSISVGALTGWPTTTGVDFCIYNVDTSGNKIAGSQTDWSGVASGTTISGLTLRAGTDNGYSVGAIVEAGPVAAWADDMASGMAVGHNQDGTHATSLPLTTPQITTSINDSNGNEVIKTPATASAVNEITVTNAATGSGPLISATGGDTNIDLKLSPKGTGQMQLYADNGWRPGSGTWTYASSTTFTVPAVDAAQMSAGTKIWLTQTSSKYFYVTGVSGTTITVTAGTDYTVANAAITAPYYSNSTSPANFPGHFAFTPSWTNLSVGNGTNVGYFSMNGKNVDVRFSLVLGSTSSVSGSITVDFPVTSSSSFSAGQVIGSALLNDNGVGNYYGPAIWATTTTFSFYVSNGQTDVRMTQANGSHPGTWNTSDSIAGSLSYEAA